MGEVILPERTTDFVSIKTKIITIIGSLITLLLMLISLTVLYQWRELIIQKLEQRAFSVAHAFSVSVIDALIYEENSTFSAEDFLENYVKDFVEKDSTISFIAIYDNNGKVVSHSHPAHLFESAANKNKALPQSETFTRQIYESPEYGWVLESYLPLKIGNKQWGGMRIAFEAQSTRNEIHSMFVLLFVFTILGNAVILGVLYLLTNRFTSSLRQLVKAMDRFDLEKKTELPQKIGNDEIGYLVNHFNQMQQRLQHSQKHLLSIQNQVYQAEKLASIGRLVSGIAHEINNPLNGIKSCLYTINKEPENDRKRTQYLEYITEGLNHIEMIVQKLLGFARQPAPIENSKDNPPIDVNEIILKTLALLSYRFDKNQIDQKTNLGTEMPAVKMDATLLQEVLMNLLINSLDALGEEGILHIESVALPNDKIKIAIRDTGCGIDAANLDLIFEPFFTTKDVGQGTGLGLAVSKSIIEAHGGTLKVESSVGKETVFTIVLPVTPIEEQKDLE